MVRRQRIGEILMAAGLIDESQLRTAVSDQQRFGAQLGEALVRRGFLSGEQLMRGLAAQLGVPVARMKGKRVAPEVLDLLPADLAVKYGCIPLFTKREGGVEVLYIGMEDPTDLRTLDELTFQIGMQLRPVVVSVTELREALRAHYPHGGRDSAGASSAAGERLPVWSDDTAPLVPRPDVEAARAELMAEPPTIEEPEPAGEPLEKPREVRTRTILRAITQLLIENGVIGRGELMERIQSLREHDRGHVHVPRVLADPDE
jgi:type IV pilus assembly protein PilB